MSEKLRLLYIAEGGMFNSVFDSQVLSPLRNLRPSLSKITILILEPYQHRNIPETIKSSKISDMRGFVDDIKVFKMPPVIGLPSIKWAAINITRNFSIKEEPDIIHCRGHFGSYIGLHLGERFQNNVRVIADLRGVTKQEFIYAGENKNKIARLMALIRTIGFGHMERLVCQKSDRIFCVSEKFSEYLIEKGYANREKIKVIPTLTNNELFKFDLVMRKQMREFLGITDKVVFVYSGSMAPWQMAKKTMELFKNIKRNIPEAFLLFLTKEPEKVKPLFSDMSANDFKLISAKYDEVSKYLNAADIGILLREKSIVNEVAAPVKIGEYLCCGLPLVISSGIGDTEKHLKEYNLGLIYKENEQLINELHKLLNLDRNYTSQIGRKLYGFDIYIPKILEIYKELAK